jgi:nitrite reductase/ring-hydroxylating ferredoxin subunit
VPQPAATREDEAATLTPVTSNPAFDARVGFVKVGHVSELEAAGQFSRWVDNHDILVFRRNGVIRACSNICPHFGGPVGYHQLTDGRFTCLWHNLQFDADTGQCLSVAKFKLREYKLVIKDTDIFAQLVENPDPK